MTVYEYKMNQESFITQLLQFDTKLVDNNLIPNPLIDAKFGIVNIKAPCLPLTKEQIEFIFTVDCSGSMSDICSDGRTKMHHILHTLKNMILYFKENDLTNCYITVNAFDNTIYKIIDRCVIHTDNFASLIAKIDTIYPRQSTNIELALTSVRNISEQNKIEFPLNTIVNIFMTDGEATSGNTNTEYLSSLVDKSITNAFIGFGITHDAELLKELSNGENSAYYFIDKLENAGFVYGEILHGILYKFLTNVELTVHNGLLYDFKNDIWCNSLNIGEIVSEADKIFHIISSIPEECVVTLHAKKVTDNSDFQITVTNQADNIYLTKYNYRQRTLQYLYIVGDFLKKERTFYKERDTIQKYVFHNLYNYVEFQEERQSIKDLLFSFITEMKLYMTNYCLTNDTFMKNLCDDIYINYTTFGTPFGAMYNNARQTSQGTQRCYTVSHTPELTIQPLDGFADEEKTIVPDLDHIVTDFEDTPYQTPGVTRLMREISCNSTKIIN